MLTKTQIVLYDASAEPLDLAGDLDRLGMATAVADTLDALEEMAARPECALAVLCPSPEAGSLQAVAGVCGRLSEQPKAPALLVCAAWLNEEDRLAVLESGADDVVAPEALLPAVLRAVPASRRTTAHGAAVSLRMAVAPGELPNVIQFLALTGRTGVLEATFADGNLAGSIFVRDCTVVHAVCENLEGMEALAWMFVQGAGEVHFVDGPTPLAVSTGGVLGGILIEASVLADELLGRQADEGRAAGEGKP